MACWCAVCALYDRGVTDRRDHSLESHDIVDYSTPQYIAEGWSGHQGQGLTERPLQTAHKCPRSHGQAQAKMNMHCLRASGGSCGAPRRRRVRDAQCSTHARLRAWRRQTFEEMQQTGENGLMSCREARYTSRECGGAQAKLRSARQAVRQPAADLPAAFRTRHVGHVHIPTARATSDQLARDTARPPCEQRGSGALDSE